MPVALEDIKYRLKVDYERSDEVCILCDDITELGKQGMGDLAFWKGVRNRMIEYLVAWSDDLEHDRLHISVYSKIALASYICAQIHGLMKKPLPYCSKPFKQKAMETYSAEEILMEVYRQEKDWADSSYSIATFKRIEMLDALIGSLLFSDYPHKIDVYALPSENNDQGNDGLGVLDHKKFLFEISTFRIRMHIYYSVVSSLMGCENDQAGRGEDEEIENFLLADIAKRNDQTSKKTFKNIFWELDVIPGEVAAVIKDSFAKAKVVTPRSAIRKLRGSEKVNYFDSILSKPIEVAYQEISQSGKIANNSKNKFLGGLLLTVFDAFYKFKFNGNEDSGFLMEFVDFKVDTDTEQKSSTRPIIIRCFSGYHVLYQGELYFCYYASTAIRKWTSIQFPDKNIFHYDE
jgi:hypothetical protein